MKTSSILLILGGLVLIAKKYIKWQVPVVMIGTVGLLAWIFGGKIDGKIVYFTGDPVLHMLFRGSDYRGVFHGNGHGYNSYDHKRADTFRGRLRNHYYSHQACGRLS